MCACLMRLVSAFAFTELACRLVLQRELGQKHPSLTIRFVSCSDSNFPPTPLMMVLVAKIKMLSPYYLRLCEGMVEAGCAMGGLKVGDGIDPLPSSILRLFMSIDMPPPPLLGLSSSSSLPRFKDVEPFSTGGWGA